MKPAPFEYYVAGVAGRRRLAARRARRRRQGARRRPESRADAGAAPHPVRRTSSISTGSRELQGIERANGTLTVGGHDPPVRRRARRRGGERPSRCWPRPCRSSVTSRSATAARSAARSPTPTPRPSCPAVALALDAELEVAGPRGTRRVPAADFFLGTVDDHDRARRDPGRRSASRSGPAGAGFAVEEIARRSGDFALAGSGLRRRARRARTRSPGSAIAFLGMAPTPVRGRAAEAALNGSTPERVRPRRDRPPRGAADAEPDRRRPRVAPNTARTSARTSWSAPSTERLGGASWLSTRSHMTVNGERGAGYAEPRKTLADFLREDLALTGTHLGCEHGVCGACTVLVDGERGALVPRVRGAGRGPRGHHHRGDRPVRRHARPGAGGVPAGPRPAVRVLHARVSS